MADLMVMENAIYLLYNFPVSLSPTIDGTHQTTTELEPSAQAVEHSSGISVTEPPN